MQIFKPNKYEFYLSLALVPLSFYGAVYLQDTFSQALLLTGATVMALLCSVNAMLDAPRMNWLEHALGMAWMYIMFIVTPLVLYGMFHLRPGYH